MTLGEPAFVLDLELPQLAESILALGDPVYRARQVWRWVYRSLVNSFSEMTDLPRSLRERLAARYTFDGLQPLRHLVSTDGLTHKVLFGLADGNTIESVLMLYDATDTSKARRTVCVSTQVGCALGCAFCATGQSGFVRNLTAGEIVGQVIHFARHIAHRETQEGENTGAPRAFAAPTPFPPITNVIFAGMGEPLANYAATLAAVRRLNDPDGFALGARHMLISTAGLATGIRRLAQEKLQVGLAISLHAPSDGLRSRLMPINRRYPLAEVLAACREYIQTTGRRVAFEYVLIEGLNSLPTHARQLAALIGDMTCMVNLIPMNPVAGSSLAAPRRETVVAFQSILNAAGIVATVRVDKGSEIRAACGQLRARAEQEIAEDAGTTDKRSGRGCG